MRRGAGLEAGGWKLWKWSRNHQQFPEPITLQSSGSTILCFVTPGPDTHYYPYTLYAPELLLRLMWSTWPAKDA